MGTQQRNNSQPSWMLQNITVIFFSPCNSTEASHSKHSPHTAGSAGTRPRILHQPKAVLQQRESHTTAALCSTRLTDCTPTHCMVQHPPGSHVAFCSNAKQNFSFFAQPC